MHLSICRVGCRGQTGLGAAVRRVRAALPPGQLGREVRAEGGELQPAGRDERADVPAGIQGGGRAPAENAAQYPPQR